MLKINMRSDLRLFDFIILAAFIGIFATLANYGFGDGNHVTKLPPILREIDKSYLVNDFYVNANSGFGPLYYYARFVTFLTALAPLTVVALLLTIISNGFVSVITFLFARDLFRGSNLAGLLASSIVMSVDHVGPIGGAAVIYDAKMLPAGLIMPLIFLAVWAAIRQKPLISITLASVASVFHPTIGIGTGGILLLTLIVSKIIHRNQKIVDNKMSLKFILAASAILAAFAALWLLPYSSSEQITSKQFIEIIAYFRAPHHYIPSTFGVVSYLKASSLLTAFGISWYWWQKSTKISKSRADFLLILTGVIMLLLAGGYIFVEIIPIRFWVSVQAFRFVFLIRWIGYVLVAGTIANLFVTQKQNISATLFLASSISPIAISIIHLSELSRNWVKQRISWFGNSLRTGLTIVLVTIALLIDNSAASSAMLFVILIFIVLALAHWTKKAFHIFLGSASLLLIITAGFRHEIELPPIIESSLIGKIITPQLTLEDLSGNAVDVAKFARDNTPKDSVFLTPPNFGQFRLTAERAIIVDFKAIPLQDIAMLEWQERLFDSYDITSSNGNSSVNKMDENFINIDDEKLADLQENYGFSFAVLYTQTVTQFPVFYENPEYKIIRLTEIQP